MNQKFVNAHTQALGALTRDGVPVTLRSPDGATTITGYAMRVRGAARAYEALKLVEVDAPTLLFAPSSFAIHPSPIGFNVVWAGVAHRVASVDVVAPNGEWVSARLVIAI